MLHYQPKCDLDGRVLGVEALVRWQHPQRGLLPPMTFVPVAERTGLVHPLTDLVLDLALAQARRLARRGPLAAGRGQHLDPQPAAARASPRRC